MHKVVPQIEKEIEIPILHIAKAAGVELRRQGIDKVGLLGTKYTMQQDFYKENLKSKQVDVIVPDKQDMEIVNSVIYQELCQGIISEKSKNEFLRIIDGLMKKGAQGIILGCTEIGLLVNQEDTEIPVFDTTYIHAKQAAMLAMEERVLI